MANTMGTAAVDAALARLRSGGMYAQLYGSDERQAERWRRLIADFHTEFGTADLRFFSAPGRTEAGGNHTDHNHGMVLAAAVDLDAIAVAAPTGDHCVTLRSQGFDQPFIVNLHQLEPVPEEVGTTSALIRGIAARMHALGHTIGGFNACVSSDVLIGSGLSSSASIEVLIGTIFNALYNGSRIDAVTIATIGQYAENHFFQKPCGLMDQLACAVGGFVMIDFRDPAQPLITPLATERGDNDLVLVVVDTGGSHADLTDDYAAIPREMKAVANALGKSVARELDVQQVLRALPRLRRDLGDRAVLRVLHFIRENERVAAQADAIRSGDMLRFLALVHASGLSSARWLQNCSTPKTGREQGILLALALTEDHLARSGPGACRVHGGGFAGTIQVWLPVASLPGYEALMNAAFGKGAVVRVKVRERGAVEV